jgi:polyisoprenoid-binding protein YceI
MSSPRTAPRRPAGPARPMRPVTIAGIVVVLVILAAGLYGLWYLFLRPSGPAAVADASLPPLPSSSAAAGASSSAGSSGSTTGSVDGTWNVDTSVGSLTDSTGTFVGYRVQEQLASIGANTAVGRTAGVTGSLTMAGSKITAATITGDLTTLKSDDNRRDGQLSHQGIDTSQFPTATFTLTSPIDLGSVPADGQTISANAVGKLTLHGQTKDVTIPVKAKRSGNEVVVSGSLPIVFADYGITKPNSFAVLSIADQGTMEFQVFFRHA